MKRLISIAPLALSTLLGLPLSAQEAKPVPTDSVRVFVPGCTRGYIFTAGRRTQDEPGSVNMPEGMHVRMNAPKKLIAEIKAHEGSMIEITGLMKRSQYAPGGMVLGGGARIGQPVGQLLIDVEGWRPIVGDCPSR
jgi:hypothetical protein